jgi:predicted ribosome-associated RNA-binding protein Tma20
MASSAASLYGLMDQLQTMELKFTSILMETAIKLASLTDSSMFLLIETPHGRRFAGKQHLCDAYLYGSLSPVGNDVQMDADLNVTSLSEKNFCYSDNAQTVVESNSLLNNLQRKRKRQDLSEDICNSQSKHSRVENIETREEAGDIKCENNVTVITLDGSPTFSEDISNIPSKQLRVENIETRKEAREIKTKNNVAVIAMDASPTIYDDSDSIFDEPDMNLSVQFDNVFSSSILTEEELTDWVSNEFLNKVMVQSKAEHIRNIHDFTLLQDKDSIERKLLRNLCYEFGKDFSVKYSKSNIDFESNRKTAFQIFWSHFSNLVKFEQIKVPYRTGRQLSLYQFCSEMSHIAHRNLCRKSHNKFF